MDVQVLIAQDYGFSRVAVLEMLALLNFYVASLRIRVSTCVFLMMLITQSVMDTLKY